MKSSLDTPATNQALDAAVLTQGFLRAGSLVGFTKADLAQVLGVSAPTLSRLGRDRDLDPTSKEGELALLFLGLLRDLDLLVGGDADAIQRWLKSHHHALSGIPAELVKTARGLVHVHDHLDALCARD